jgi:hypothetical protein
MLCALVELVLHVIRKLQMDAVRPVRGECHTSTPPAVLPAMSDGIPIREIISAAANGEAANVAAPTTSSSPGKGEAPRSQHLSEHRPGGGSPHALKLEDNPLPASTHMARNVLAALPLAGGGDNLRTSHR